MEENLGWALIPPDVLSDEKLTSTEKLLLGRIIGLSGKSGHCFASNAWLSQGLGLTKRNVSDCITVLVDKGYVIRKIDRDANNVVVGRRLYSVNTLPRSIVGGIPLELGTSPDETEETKGRVEGRVKKKNPPSDKPKRETVKKEDLDHLTEGYAARKGVRPQGDEWKPIQQAFRHMLLDGNTVEQIEGCEDAIVNEGWTWTINTVRHWMPDFRAGKFPSKDGRDADRIRALQDDIDEIDRYIANQLNSRLIELGQRDTEPRDLIVEEAEEAARLEQLWHEKMKEKERLAKELKKVGGER